MNPTQLAEKVLAKMLENDAFSRWLGLEVLEMAAGSCRLQFQIRGDMLNGFGTVHGGVLFSAADSAFAFACNSHGRLSVALDTSITFTRPSREGDLLTVTASEINLGNKTSLYEVKIRNENHQLVALFKGTAYRTEKKIME